METPKYYPPPQLPANIPYQEIYDALIEMNDTFTLLSDRANNLTNVLCTPQGYLIEPARPLSVPDQTTWDDYRTAIAAYYTDLQINREKAQVWINTINTSLQLLMALIPPNAWVTLSVDTIFDWPHISGDPAPPLYVGWHTYDALDTYVPVLLGMQPGHAPTQSLTDGVSDPVYSQPLSVDAVLAQVPNLDAAAFARVMEGDYSGG